MSEEKLSNIQNLLDDIKALFLLVNQDKLEEMKKKVLRPESIEERVYNLCSNDITTDEIVSEIQKDKKYANAVISTLRQKGLVRTFEKEGKKVHEQRF